MAYEKRGIIMALGYKGLNFDDDDEVNKAKQTCLLTSQQVQEEEVEELIYL